MIQVQNLPEVTKDIEKLGFSLFIQSESGNLYFEEAVKIPNFMERVYAELAMRENERDGSKISLTTVKEDGHKMCMYQHFSFNDNVYVQVFANKDPNYVWIQKIRPTMNNVEILGAKNQKKPLDVRVEPFREKVVIIQQVNAKNFQFVGGQGDFMLERIKKT